MVESQPSKLLIPLLESATYRTILCNFMQMRSSFEQLRLKLPDRSSSVASR